MVLLNVICLEMNGFDKTFQNNQIPSFTLDVFCAMLGLSKSTHLDKTKNQKTTQEKLGMVL